MLIQKSVKKQLDSIVTSKPHATLLHGRFGVGLASIAKEIAAKLTPVSNIVTVQPDEKGTIKIKTIRELYAFTRSKQHEKLVIIVDDADTMQAPAQNALLKLLEEPPEHVMFILTAHNPQILLPTILSRVQKIEIVPLSNTQTEDLLKELGVTDEKKRLQLQYMAMGLPAELTRLVRDKEYFAARSASIKEARAFIQGTTYEKLITSYRVGSNRDKAMDLVRDIAHIVEVSLKQKPSSSLSGLLANIVFTQEKLLADGNIRTQLLKLSVS